MEHPSHKLASFLQQPDSPGKELCQGENIKQRCQKRVKDLNHKMELIVFFWKTYSVVH